MEGNNIFKFQNILEEYIICDECSNIPLLGIEFSEKSKNLNDIININSFCIFNHQKNKKDNRIKKLKLSEIFSNKSKKNKKLKTFGNKCDNCKVSEVIYLCLECKRNICKECVKYHKSHKLYENIKYLFTKNDLEKMYKDLEKSKNILTKNLNLIQKQIDLYKSQLIKLQNIYEECKSINKHLYHLSIYIIEKYKNKMELNFYVSYPIYFNITNNLSFNLKELEMPKEELSIKAYTDILTEQIKSGLLFLILESNFTKNLDDYANTNFINLSKINLNEFSKIKLDYSKIIPLDNIRIIGIKKEDFKLQVYNIKDKQLMTSIKLNLKKIINLIYQNNLIFVMNELAIYIINPDKISIIQSIKLLDKIETDNKKNKNKSIWGNTKEEDSYVEKTKHEFKSLIILSKNSFGVIYEGNLDFIDKPKVYSFIKPKTNLNGYNIINSEYGFDSEYSQEFVYLLIYNKNNNDIFVLEKIILLLKKNIFVNEIDYTSDKYFESCDEFPYCTFYFDSFNIISDNNYIIGFKSRIKCERDQEYYYITEKNYSNQTIYYNLNVVNNTINILCQSKEKSFLYKDDKENKFYFLYDASVDCAGVLKSILAGYQFVEIKMKNLNYRNFQNKKMLGWKNNSIFLGNIGFNKQIEIIQSCSSSNYITFVDLKYKNIFYDVKTKKDYNTDSDDICYSENGKKNYNDNYIF